MRKILLGLILALSLWFVPLANAACAATTCFWIGTVNTNWNQSGNWSDTSGGLTNASTPTTGDRLCFDSAGNTASTMNAAFSIASINTAGTCTGGSSSPHTAGITHGAFTLTNTGNDAGANGGTTHLIAATTVWTASNPTTSLLSFTSTSGTTTVTQNSSGANRNVGSTTFNGGGGTFNLGGDIIGTATSTITSTAGALNFSGFNSSFGVYDLSSTTARTVTCGSGTLTGTGTISTVWNVTNSANLTLTCNTGTISLVAVATGSRTIIAGGKTYNNISVVNAAASPLQLNFNVTGFTAANVTFTNVRRVTLAGGVTFTISGTLTYDALTTQQGSLASDGSSAATLSVGSSNTISWLFIQNITRSGAGTITANSSFDGGGNNTSASFVINAPSGGGSGGKIIGG